MTKMKKAGLWAAILLAELLISFGLPALLTAENRAQGQILKGEGEAPYLYTDPETGPEQAEMPLLSLPGGSYRITIDYDTASEALCRTWYQTAWGTDYGDSILLVKEAHTKTFEQISLHRMEDFYLTSGNPDLTIRSVTVQPTGQLQRVLTFICLCLCLAADVLVWIRKKGVWSRLSFWQKNAVWGVLLIGFASSVPLFTNYLLNGADLSFHLMRIEGLAAGLAEGSFPVKLQPLWINDYRYPVSVMYGDLLLYPVALLRLLGFPLQTTYKIYLFMMNLLTAAVAYYCGKKIADDIPAALTCSLMYTFAGYRLTNMYSTNALGAVTSLLFLPVVFLGLWTLLNRKTSEKRIGPVLLLVTGYTGLVQSHLLGFEMAVLFSVLVCLLNLKAFFRELLTLVMAAVLTILLNAGFLVPMFDYMLHQNLHVFHAAPANLQQTGLFLPQIFQMFPFYTESDAGGTSSPVYMGIGNELLMGVGTAFFAILILYLWEHTVVRDRIRQQFAEESGSCGRLAGLMALGMLMSGYVFPWKALGDLPAAGRFFSVFQFATRFTMAALVFGLMLTAYVLKHLRSVPGDTLRRTIMAGLCIVALISGGYAAEMLIAQGNPLKVTGASGLDTRTAVISGEYVPEGTYGVLLNNPEPEPEEGVIVSNYRKEKGVITFWAENTLEKEGYIKVPRLNYTGYHVADMETGRELYFGNGDQNVILTIVPAGYSGAVKVYFKEPKLWRLAELVSLMALIGTVSAVWVCRRRGRGTGL